MNTQAKQTNKQQKVENLVESLYVGSSFTKPSGSSETNIVNPTTEQPIAHVYDAATDTSWVK